MTKLSFQIDEELANITIKHNGKAIPVICDKDGVYFPVKFYGKVKENAGIELVNIFSKRFSIEIADMNQQQKLSFEWKENMTTGYGP